MVAAISGRKNEDVVVYLMSLPETVRLGIKAVSMDMSRSYCYSILEFLPNAKPVIDRFHISQQLHHCIDDTRKHIQNRIRKYESKDEVFKIRWAIIIRSRISSVGPMDIVIVATGRYD